MKLHLVSLLRGTRFVRLTTVRMEPARAQGWCEIVLEICMELRNMAGTTLEIVLVEAVE
jgi:hypothetical protein